MHVTYYDILNQDLCYAMYNGRPGPSPSWMRAGGYVARWSRTTTTSNTSSTSISSLAKTPLSYITNSGAKWVTTMVDQQGDVGEQQLHCGGR